MQRSPKQKQPVLVKAERPSDGEQVERGCGPGILGLRVCCKVKVFII